jgi:DNA-binding NarL/FixJ family response regulator
MSKIGVGIYVEHLLLGQAIANLIANHDDIEVIFVENDRQTVAAKMKQLPANVLVMHTNDMSTVAYNQIVRLSIEFQRTKILVLSETNSEDAIVRTIKAGAKGFLDKDAGRKEFVEAILTLRSGHDYYSNSITHLLLQRYVGKIGTENTQHYGLNLLSQRQIEVLKLWGESFSNQEIAEKMFISQRTVETHKNHIMQKLNLKSTVDMIKFAIRNNLIEV